MVDYRRRSHSNKSAMSLRDVAFQLGISERTVRRLVNDGRLASCRFGNSVRVLEADLSEFLLRSRESASAQQLIGDLITAIKAADKSRVQEVLLILREEHDIPLMLGKELDREVTE